MTALPRPEDAATIAFPTGRAARPGAEIAPKSGDDLPIFRDAQVRAGEAAVVSRRPVRAAVEHGARNPRWRTAEISNGRSSEALQEGLSLPRLPAEEPERRHEQGPDRGVVPGERDRLGVT